MKKLIQNKIYVQKSQIHGYGVFAETQIRKGEIVEQCHALKIREEDTILNDYCFQFKDIYIIALGFGSIYNHADKPNLDFDFEPETGLLEFRTNRLIHAGEELFCYYGKEWFSSRLANPKRVAAWRRMVNSVIFRGVAVSSLVLVGVQWVTR